MSDSQFYTKESLAALDKAIRSISPSCGIVSDYLFHRFHVEGIAREYINQGFLRRLSTMERCAIQIFRICPPNICKLADPNVSIDIAIFLQSFYIHLYGAFENLARVNVELSGSDLTDGEKRAASFLSKKINKKTRSSLHPVLLDYHSTERMSTWREHLNDFRHTLAHRIPLYIPSSSIRPEDEEAYRELSAEQEQLLKECAEWVLARPRSYETAFHDNQKVDEYRQRIAELEQKQSDLEFFTPVATHSYSEGGSPIGFHGQVIANWNTLLEFLCCFLGAMQTPLGNQMKTDLIEVGIPLNEV